MCFSLQASVSASAGLMVLGYLSLKEVRARRQTLFALVPLLFSIQQFCEGLIWADANGYINNASVKQLAAYGFLTFAFLIWPFYIPLSIYKLEEKKKLKKILRMFAIFGGFVSLILLYYFMKSGAGVEILGSSVCYRLEFPRSINILGLILYLFATITPFFISTVPLMSVLGSIFFLSCISAYYFWFSTFISVWCFFAAILSGCVILVLKRVNRG